MVQFFAISHYHDTNLLKKDFNCNQVSYDPRVYRLQKDALQLELRKAESLDSLKETLKGKRVLVLVHGLYNTPAKAMLSYMACQKNLEALELYKEQSSYVDLAWNIFKKTLGLPTSDNQPLHYDAVVGVMWPSLDPSQYAQAEQNIVNLAPRISTELSAIKDVADRVDVMAHSLGCRGVLEALQYADTTHHKKIADHVFCLAPAVEKQALENKERFERAPFAANSLYVFSSKNDLVLQKIFSIYHAGWDGLSHLWNHGWDKWGEGYEALGYDPKNHVNFPENSTVQYIDCTPIVAHHGDYFSNPKIMSLIHKILTDQHPKANIHRSTAVNYEGQVIEKEYHPSYFDKQLADYKRAIWGVGLGIGALTYAVKAYKNFQESSV